ncbi:VOC family protein [Corynebacterium sp. L4756]|uniref:VOC family protein n=1 Tax=unclassified Corynebacterium TaxID=2624378 RepID=UPI00374DBA6A
MPAFMSEVGMPYWIDLTTSDAEKSAEFYRKVLDWEVTAETDEYRIGRMQGLPIGGFIPQPADSTMPDTWVTYFRAGNLEKECQRAEELGGKVLSGPQQVELGQMALLTDAAGALFGLIEPANTEQFVAAGEPGLPVWHELTATKGFTESLDFYGELFNWEIHKAGEEYATAEEEGAAFAGIWNAKDKFPPQVGGFWQTYLGVRNMDEAIKAAVECGGEVIREPWLSTFGLMALVADSTGATITLTEVEDAPEQDPTEGDDLLGLDVEFPQQ